MSAPRRDPWLLRCAQFAVVVLTLVLMIRLAPASPGHSLTPAWSGIWSDAAGQHRCALQVSGESGPSRLVVLCQLGADGGGFLDVSPAPPAGWQMFLERPVAPFGGAGGQITWGQITWFAVCDHAGAGLYAAAYTPPTTVGFTLRPVARSSAADLCPPGARP